MEFQNLQSLLNRATAPASEEEAKHYCTRFTTLVNQEPDGASRAITLLIAKVQSQNEPVALRAIHVMDQCAKHCGKPFQTQIGKFRFLNELIKLVSPKYAGGQTPVAVRSAIVQQLKLWSTTYKDQTKIVDAYNMLDKTGNTKIKTVETEFSYAAGEDADKAALLAQLLKSKNKQDLETANQMIKDMVAAEGRKIEQDAELLKDVSLIHNNGRLLAEMLANTNRTKDEKLLLDELHKTCVGLRPKLYRLAGQLSDSAQLSSVVEAGETLNRAIEQYEMQGCGAPPQVTAYKPPTLQSRGADATTAAQQQPVADLESTTLINLEEDSGTSTRQTLSADDFDDFLSAVTYGPSISAPSNSISTPNITTAAQQTTVQSNGTMETSSSGLFGGMTLQPQPPSKQPHILSQPPSVPAAPPPAALQHTTQQPAAQNNNDFADALGLFSFDTPPSASSTATIGAATGSLLDDIFSTPLQQRSGLMQEGILQPELPVTVQSTAPEVAPATGDTFDLLLPELTGASFNTATKPKPTLSQLSANKQAPAPSQAPSLLSAPVAPPRDVLCDVNVPLTLIRPCSVPPTLVYDSAVIRVNLYSTENKPEPCVDVWLITVTNSSTTPIDDVDFHMKISGNGNLKLAAPSSKHLSPFSPICPASPIQQVLVTTGDNICINYSLKYKYNTEIKSESGTLTLK